VAEDRYCSNYGQELGEGARFCSNCGRTVTHAAQEAREPEANNQLFEVTSSPFYGGWPRTTILAFRNHVVVRQKPALARVQEIAIRYGKIAAVNVTPGLSH
jgi:predicted amidophosphoribosyltransferase